jgi:hypothetical protein
LHQHNAAPICLSGRQRNVAQLANNGRNASQLRETNSRTELTEQNPPNVVRAALRK